MEFENITSITPPFAVLNGVSQTEQEMFCYPEIFLQSQREISQEKHGACAYNKDCISSL